jgi:hypothetical protein
VLQSRSRYLKISAPGQTRVVHIYFVIIHLEQDQASERNRYFIQKIMKT